MAREANITEADEFFKGMDRQVQFLIVNAAGSPQTMTGWALAYYVYPVNSSAAAVVTKTTVSGLAIDNGDGTDDRVTVDFDAADTTSLGAGTYRHVLQRTDTGYKDILAYGTLVLLHPRGT